MNFELHQYTLPIQYPLAVIDSDTLILYTGIIIFVFCVHVFCFFKGNSYICFAHGNNPIHFPLGSIIRLGPEITGNVFSCLSWILPLQ